MPVRHKHASGGDQDDLCWKHRNEHHSLVDDKLEDCGLSHRCEAVLHRRTLSCREAAFSSPHDLPSVCAARVRIIEAGDAYRARMGTG